MKPFHPNQQEQENGEVRRGPWTPNEDNLLIRYISHHGEGKWNLLAKSAGLKRTGKSCRLRWLNYLKPDLKRGNLTPQEQLVILELHSKWGNKWSKIAQHLPGRTDNEIKNYWRTRVQKQARQLNMESNSQGFFDAIRCFYMPRLVQNIEQSSFASEITDHQKPRATFLPLEESVSSSRPLTPSKLEVDKTDHSYMEFSSSGSNPFEDSVQPSNPLKGYPSGDVQQWKENSAFSLEENWYYLDNSNYDLMKELPYVSDSYMADHSWLNKDMADDTWSMEDLW